MSDSAAALQFRPPSVSTAAQNTEFALPPAENLLGKWHVIQSTLPMWKSSQNVCITYTPLPETPEKLDDLVEYQSLAEGKPKTVRGIDTPDSAFPASYNWRGRGWLKVASSHWEVLGYGEQEEGWAVTYFAKTLFTPAGIDVYSRRKEGLSDALLLDIHEKLKQIPDDRFTNMLAGIFAVRHD